MKSQTINGHVTGSFAGIAAKDTGGDIHNSLSPNIEI